MPVISIKKGDLKIRTFKGSGPGGQHRNTTETGVEIIHLQTGIKATACLRSQQESRKAAMRVLLSRLLQHYKTPTQRFRAEVERVRTYHAVDNYVVDHASGFRQPYTHVVQKGDLSQMIEARLRVKGQ